jgi:hypothetical protein
MSKQPIDVSISDARKYSKRLNDALEEVTRLSKVEKQAHYALGVATRSGSNKVQQLRLKYFEAVGKLNDSIARYNQVKAGSQ